VLADAPRLFRGVQARVIEAASAPSSKSTS
jgi:hypothetical protein